MADSIVFEKSKDFAVRTVKLYKYLNEEKHECILSKQLVRSGTSIGANISEALSAISKKEFLEHFDSAIYGEEWIEQLQKLKNKKWDEFITNNRDVIMETAEKMDKIVKIVGLNIRDFNVFLKEMKSEKKEE